MALWAVSSGALPGHMMIGMLPFKTHFEIDLIQSLDTSISGDVDPPYLDIGGISSLLDLGKIKWLTKKRTLH